MVADVLAEVAADEAGDLPAAGPGLVDAHHHVWDLGRRPQPWLQDEAPVLRRSFGVDDLRAAAAGGLAGRALVATVLVQCLPDSTETEDLLALAAAEPLVAGVVGWVDLTGPGVGDELDRLRARPGGDRLVGVRHLVQGEPDPRWLLRDDVRRGLAAVASRDLQYDVLVLPHQLPAAAALARALPDVPLVLDHAGKPPLREGDLRAWVSDLRALAASPQVTCKLSGLVSEAFPTWSVADLRPAAEEVLDAFGPERVLFGSDWPVCVAAGGWARWAEAAEHLVSGLTPAERDDVLAGTAVRTYGLARARRPSPPTSEEALCS